MSSNKKFEYSIERFIYNDEYVNNDIDLLKLTSDNMIEEVKIEEVKIDEVKIDEVKIDEVKIET